MLPCRIVELFPAVPINPHWGIVSKCLTYSKAACDPFVYSLLRHQYKKTCTDIINRLLKRSSLNASGSSQDNRVNCIPTTEWWPMCWVAGGGGGVADWRDTVWELTWQLSLNHKVWFSVSEEENRTGGSSPRLLESSLTCPSQMRNLQQTRANLCTVTPLCLHTECPEEAISAVNSLRVQ